jgi:hypothetical protein
MRRRAVLPLIAVVAMAAVWLSAPAAATPPTRQGWWKARVVVAGLDLSALLAPPTADVPADGLLVAGGTTSNAPQAYAAVAYDLGGGALEGPLRLLPHPSAASVPGSGAMVCPLDNPVFQPSQGGFADTAPKYDCLGAVVATVDDKGAYVFDVTTLQREGIVAVAILPTTATSRIVFAVPGADSLPVGAAAAPTVPPPVNDTAPVVADTPSFAPGGIVGTPPAARAPTVTTNDTPAAAPLPSPSAPVVSAIRAAASEGSAPRAYVMLALAALAGGGWIFAGRDRRAAAAR